MIVPPNVHCKVLTLSSAGALSRITGFEIAPVTQGAGVNGVHGTGVGVPSAAEVAETKAGLPGDMHVPNGMMFTIGT